MLSKAYPHFVCAQIEMSLGRFKNVVTSAEKAGQLDPRSSEISVLLNNVRAIARAHARGNDLFKSERYTEACAAYREGLRLHPMNSVLYCNRAACWYKLGQWERSHDDCNQALLRRAASNSKIMDLISRMQKSWPSLSCPSYNGFSLWFREWKQHCTCSESVLDEHSYFKSALNLKDKVKLLQTLRNAGSLLLISESFKNF